MVRSLIASPYRAVSLLVLLAAILACHDPVGPTKGSRVGVIASHGDPVVITLPDTVEVGESFSVSVRTYGGGCTNLDRTEARSDGMNTDITPYDAHSGARICPDILKWFDHIATIAVQQPGRAQIRVHGRKLPDDVRITELREVVVR
jgi:hypothetical protein